MYKNVFIIEIYNENRPIKLVFC